MGKARSRKRDRHAVAHRPLPRITATPGSAQLGAGPSAKWPLGLVIVILMAYIGVAWLASGNGDWYALDMIGGVRVFSIDDAYRYFSARSAWLDGKLYAWNYVLPAALLLDGALSTLLDGDIFLMRVAHALGACGVLLSVYASGRHLGATRPEMIFSVAILATMPLFVFVMQSFYGEAWLTLFYALGILAFVTGRLSLAVALFAFMPLIRPEGLLYLLPLATWLLLNRHWSLLTWLLLPSSTYVLYLLASLENLTDYTEWRVALRTLLMKVPSPLLNQPLGIFSTFNLFWVAPTLTCLFMAPMRRLWPIFAGPVSWVIYNIASISADTAYYEARYFVSVLPALAIAWPFAIRPLRGIFSRQRILLPGALIVPLLSGAIMAEHLLQLDPVRNTIAGRHRWPVPGPRGGSDHFGMIERSELNARKKTAQIIISLLHDRPEIDLVLILDTSMLYDLNPRLVPEDVRVVYTPTSEQVAATLLDGLFFGMYPGRRQFGYFRLSFGSIGGPGRALFVGRLDTPELLPTHASRSYFVYEVNYIEAQDPTSPVLSMYPPHESDLHPLLYSP